MKLALKILGAIILTLVAAVAIFYFGWLSPPAADSVCDNVGRIFKEKTGVDYPPDEREKCMQRAEKAPEFGRAVWVKRLECMRDAADFEALQGCDDVTL
jgi:hypothetical protein